MSAILARRFRRFLRRLGRYPRVVTYNQYMNLTRALPGEQRKCAELEGRLARAGERIRREHGLHLTANQEKEELKALLGDIDHAALVRWKAMKVAARPT